MDTKIIQQYGEEILCYGLRTARQKKQMRYKDLDKKLIGLHKEQKKLYFLKSNLGWEPLIPPVQNGWKRFFVLREDVARSKQATFFENILKKINTREWSHRRDFVIRRRKQGRKIYVVKPQELLRPHEYHFAKLNFSEAEKQLFHEEYHFQQGGKRQIKRYVFNEPWRFVLRVRPNMIDKTRRRDDEIESGIKEIDNYLEGNDYVKKQSRLLRGSYKYKPGKDERNEKYNWRNRCTEWILDQIKKEVSEVIKSKKDE